ncbi:MAG: PaaI family thioesterase [Pseudomonadota bacterium]
MSDDKDTRPPLIKSLGPDALNRYVDKVPHAAALGLEVTMIAHREAELRMPYREDLIGYPETRVVAGGVITTLLDNVAGLSVACAIEELVPFATLDLRIDYMRPAVPDEAICGYAHCFKVTENIAFVRGLAHHGDRTDPIATATATFMLNTKTQHSGGAGAKAG